MDYPVMLMIVLGALVLTYGIALPPAATP